MNRYLTFLLVLGVTAAQANTGFEQTYGNPQCYNEGVSIVKLEDNTHLISGFTNCGGGVNNWESLLIKTDEEGNTAWTKQGIAPNGLMKLTSDNKLIFLGGNTAGYIYDTIKVFKTTTDGEIIWSNSFVFSSCNNSAWDIIETHDGGFAFTGIFVDDCAQSSFNGFMVKLDKEGSEQWRKTYGLGGDDQLMSIRQLHNGHYALFGWTQNYGAQDIDYWLLKVDESGSMLMTETYGGAGNQYGYGMDITNDGGFILNGYDSQMKVVKVDNWGREQWTKTYGDVCGGTYFRAVQLADNGFVFMGSQTIDNTCRTAMIRTDINGNPTDQKDWSGRLRNVTIQGNSIMLSGYVDYLPEVMAIRYETVIRNLGSVEKPSTTEQVFFIHGDVDEEFETPTGTKEYGIQDVRESALAYPNPAQQETRLTFSNPNFDIYTLDLYDIKGGKMRTISNITNDHVVIRQLDLANGSYIYKLRSDNGDIYMGKIVFQ